jgi:hypothetical protein
MTTYIIAAPHHTQHFTHTQHTHNTHKHTSQQHNTQKASTISNSHISTMGIKYHFLLVGEDVDTLVVTTYSSRSQAQYLIILRDVKDLINRSQLDNQSVDILLRLFAANSHILHSTLGCVYDINAISSNCFGRGLDLNSMYLLYLPKAPNNMIILYLSCKQPNPYFHRQLIQSTGQPVLADSYY